MQAIEIRPGVNVGLDEVIKGVTSVNTTELEFFLAEIQNILIARKNKTLSRQETDLLLVINQGISYELRKKYDLLSEKMDNNSLTSSESEELMKIVDIIEMQDAKRLEALIHLAKMRGVSLDVLMRQLEINKSNYA